MYERIRCAPYPNTIESGAQIKPNTPAQNDKSIASGINGNTKIFAGSDTKERMPVEYKRSGRTAIIAESVVATSSRKPNRDGKYDTSGMTRGVIQSTPYVAIHDS